MEVTRLRVVPRPWCALCPPAVSAAVVPGWALERCREAARGAGKSLPSGKVASRLLCGHHDIHTEARKKV